MESALPVLVRGGVHSFTSGFVRVGVDTSMSLNLFVRSLSPEAENLLVYSEDGVVEEE